MGSHSLFEALSSRVRFEAAPKLPRSLGLRKPSAKSESSGGSSEKSCQRPRCSITSRFSPRSAPS